MSPSFLIIQYLKRVFFFFCKLKWYTHCPVLKNVAFSSCRMCGDVWELPVLVYVDSLQHRFQLLDLWGKCRSEARYMCKWAVKVLSLVDNVCACLRVCVLKLCWKIIGYWSLGSLGSLSITSLVDVVDEVDALLPLIRIRCLWNWKSDADQQVGHVKKNELVMFYQSELIV